MSTRKQREMIRQRRMEFDRRVVESREKMEKFVKESKKKRGRPKKEVKKDDVSGTDK